MSSIVFYLFWLINWVVTLLPLRILYIFSDFLFLILYYFPSYRRKVVATNLRNAFPEKSREELRKIEKKFYKHLADVFVETLKMTHISREEMKKRFILTNPEVLTKINNEGRDIAAICAHYCNWEWMSALPLFTDIKCTTIYKPLHNKLFDKFLNDIRRKKGFFLTPMSNIVREIVTDKKNGVNALYAFITDQTPANVDVQYWTTFLNQDTPVFVGVEKIAAKYDMAVVYFDNQKTRRGYYTFTAELLFDHPAGLPEHTVTEAHVRKLEEIINKQPEYWVWSHKRWKHKRQHLNG
jgi:Kdo2-lipid IVA lauroyltransferase/acyltransferase